MRSALLACTTLECTIFSCILAYSRYPHDLLASELYVSCAARYRAYLPTTAVLSTTEYDYCIFTVPCDVHALFMDIRYARWYHNYYSRELESSTTLYLIYYTMVLHHNTAGEAFQDESIYYNNPHDACA